MNKLYNNSVLFCLCLFIGFLPSYVLSQNYNATTFAGAATAGYTDATGTNARFNGPSGMAVDANGNSYVADRANHVIRKISPTGVVTTLAGSGSPGFVNGTGTAASFNNPVAVAVDANGTVYVADMGNHRIRRVSSDGLVTTFAGTGIPGYTASGFSTSVMLNSPSAIAISSDGNNLFVCDKGNSRIKRINVAFASDFAGSGSVGFTNGGGTSASFNGLNGIAVDANNVVYVSDSGNHAIRKILSDGTVSTLAGSGSAGSANGTGTAATFNGPKGIVLDGSGNIIVADQLNHRIRQITSAGVVTTLAGSTAGFNNATNTTARFNNPTGLAIDANGVFYIGDFTNNRIRKLTNCVSVPSAPTLSHSGTVTICSNETLTLTSATRPGYLWTTGETTQSISVNTAGAYSLLAVDGLCTSQRSATVTVIVNTAPTAPTISGGNVLPIGGTVTLTSNNPTGNLWSNGATTQSVIVSNPGIYTVRKVENGCTSNASNSIAVDFESSDYVVTTIAGSTAGFSNGTGTGARFNIPGGIVVGNGGSLFIADQANQRIREVTTAGVVTTFAGSSSAGTADGTGTAATFFFPTGIAADASNNLYVTDRTSNRIRKITPAGVVTTLAGSNQGSTNGTGTAASFFTPKGIGVDASGNVYVADASNYLVRKITPAGVVTTLAGSGTLGSADGTGTSASFSFLEGLAVDYNGNIYVTDRGNNKVRKITQAGVVTTFAGSGTAGSADGVGTAASFNSPAGITTDAVGNIYVTEFGTDRVRKITQAGVVTTIAGTGTSGTTDGMPEVAQFNNPYGITVAPNGDIYLVEEGNHTVRKISRCIRPAAPTATLLGSSQICNGETTQLTSSVSTGNIWSNGATSQTITVSTGGTYSVQTISGTCTSAKSNAIVVTLKATPGQPTISGGNYCAGGTTTLSTTYSLGTNESFLWSDNSTGSTLVVSTPGSYSLRIRNSVTGCTSAVSNVLSISQEPTPATPTISGSSLLCSGGSVVLTASSAPAYLWSNGATTQSITVTTAGNYSVRTHAVGNICYSLPSNVITVVNSTTPSTPTISGTLSFTGNTGTILTSSASAGYLWSTGATTQSITVKVPGIYTVQVSNGCQFSGPASVTVTKPFNNYTVSNFAGNGTSGFAVGSGTTARFNGVNGITRDGNNNFYVTDFNNHVIRRISETGNVTEFAGQVAASGFADGTGSVVRFNNPHAVVIDGSGNLYVADQGNHCIRRITAGGTVSTFAGVNVSGYSDATGTSARFNSPSGLAINSAGEIFVADYNNNRIRKISTSGVVTTFAGSGTNASTDGTGTAASFAGPISLACDGQGNIYVSEFTGNKIRKITPSGVVTTIAGSGVVGFFDGAAAQAKFNGPSSLAIDEGGNLFIADYNNHYIRRLTSDGVVSTIAGEGAQGLVNGIGLESRFSNPQGIYADLLGTLYVADRGNHVIRKLDYCETAIAAPVITGPTSFCTGSPITLTSSIASGNIWNTGATTQSITVSAGGSYFVNRLDGSCSSPKSNTIGVTEFPNPSTPSITAGATTICSGSSTTISTTYSLGINEAYLWSDNSSGSTLTATAAGTYSLRIRNTASGCTSAISNTITINVIQSPTAPVITGPTSICSNETAVYTTSYVLGPNEAYLWSTFNSSNGISVNYPSSFSLRIRNTATGCTSAVSNVIALVVNTTPGTPLISGPATYCPGGSTTLMSSATSGNLWSNGATTRSITVSNPGGYSVRQVVGTCTSNSSNIIYVAESSIPNTPTIIGSTLVCNGNPTFLYSSVFGNSYIWSNGSTGQDITVSTPGTYTVRVISGGCTSAVSSPVTVTATDLSPYTRTIAGFTFLTSVGGKDYYLSNSAATWSASRTSCIAAGGDLASLETEAEWEAVRINAGSSIPLWIGLTDEVTEGTYRWVSGSDFNYGIWNTNEPNNSGGNEDYAAFAAGTAGFINDLGSSATARAILEVDQIGRVTSNSPVTAGGTINLFAPTIAGASYSWTGPNGFSSTLQNPSITNAVASNTGSYYLTVSMNGCNRNFLLSVSVNCANSVRNSPRTIPGFTYAGSLGKNDYYLSNSAATWDAARTACTNAGGDLVSVESAAEWNFIKSVAVTNIWLGLTDAATEGTFQWVSGAPLNTTFWNSGEPNNFNGNEDHVAIRAVGGIGWNDYIGTNNFRYILELPQEVISATNSTVSAGSEIRFTTTTIPNVTYSWTGPNGFTSSEQSPVISSATPQNAGSYILTTTRNGCNRKDTFVVAVNCPTIPTPTISGTLTFCAGSSTTLTSSNPNGNIWSNGATTQSITVTTGGNYTVRTVINGCSSMVSNQVAVTTTGQDPSIFVRGATTICAGQSVTLASYSSTARICNRVGENSNLTLTTPNGNIFAAVNFASYGNSTGSCGSYVQGACHASNSQSIVEGYLLGNTTGSIPATNALFTDPCNGTAKNLAVEATYLTSESGSTYLWSNGATTPFISVSPVSTTTYTCTVYVAGCTLTDAVTIVVNPSQPTITGTPALCSGGSTTLTSSSATGNLWSNGATTQSITVTSTGNYSVRVINGSCTSANSSVVTVVNTTDPSIYVRGNTTICNGQSVALTSYATMASVCSRVNENDNLSLTAPNNGRFVNIDFASYGNSTGSCGSYVQGSCHASNSRALIEPIFLGNNTGTVQASNGFFGDPCNGTVKNLAVQATYVTTETGSTYLWSNGATTQTINVNPASTTTYRCTVSVAGCTYVDEVTITVNPSQPTISGNNTFCVGGSTILTATAASGYIWSNGATTQSITVTSSGSYTVRTIANSCTSAVSEAFTVVANTLPTTPTISGNANFCFGTSTVLTSSAATGNLWSTGETTQSITVLTPGTYTVRQISGACTTVASTPVIASTIASGTWLGVTTDWNNAANWCGGVPTASTDITLPSAGTLPVISGTTATCRNLTIPVGVTLNIGNASNFNLRGNLLGLGNIAGAFGSLLTLNGTTTQTIQRVNVGTLVVNNSAGITLGGNVTLSNGITLTNGILNTGSHNLILLNTAQSPTETASSYVIGNFRNTARTVGTGSVSMFGITIASGTDNLDTVMIERGENAATYNGNEGIGHIWKIRAGNQPVSGRQITLSWSARADNGKDLSNLQVYRRPDIGGEWIRMGGLVNGTSRSITLTTNSFSDWTVSDGSSPLPVTLTSFIGKATQFGNQLTWTTSSEVNNQGFNIERSADGKTFTKIGFVKGNGTTNTKQTYQFTDLNAIEAYYRLQQVDFDGKPEYSETIKVGESTIATQLNVFPNPASNKVTISTTGAGTIEIVNNLGQVMISQPAIGNNEINISKLAMGVYTVRFNGLSQKLVVR